MPLKLLTDIARSVLVVVTVTLLSDAVLDKIRGRKETKNTHK